MRWNSALIILIGCLATTALAQDNTTMADAATPVTGLQVEATDFFDQECDNISNCTDNRVCANDSTGVMKCRCEVEDSYKRDVDADKCIRQQELHKECIEGKSKCITNNAICKDDGSNSGTTRCECKGRNTEFVHVKDAADMWACSKVLTKSDNEACKECNDNEGLCYESPDNATKALCKCPISRSGEMCETIHVDVKCDLETFKMKVCYTPHDDLSGQGISMYPDGYGSTTDCIAKMLTNDTATANCPAGSYFIELPMSPEERDKCGTKAVDRGTDSKKFENIFMVGPRGSRDPDEAKHFKTYCSFNTHASKPFGSLGLLSLNMNDRGEHLEPTLDFSVLNEFDEELPKGFAIKLKDDVKLVIALENDGTYAALRVLMCTGSSSGTIPDPYASTLPITRHGCPVSADKGGLSDVVMWSRSRGRPHIMTTNRFPIFKTPKSNTVVIHCTVELCLKGSENECMPMTKEECAAKPSSRKRRAAEEPQRAEVSKSVQVWDPDLEKDNMNTFFGMSTAGFAVIISLLVALVLVAVFVAAIVGYRMKVKNNKIGDNVELTTKPQRFALPRVQRNHLRL